MDLDLIIIGGSGRKEIVAFISIAILLNISNGCSLVYEYY